MYKSLVIAALFAAVSVQGVTLTQRAAPTQTNGQKVGVLEQARDAAIKAGDVSAIKHKQMKDEEKAVCAAATVSAISASECAAERKPAS